MSIWENNGNGNKCLAAMGMGMGLKLVGMGRNGKLKAIPAHLYPERSLLCTCAADARSVCDS